MCLIVACKKLKNALASKTRRVHLDTALLVGTKKSFPDYKLMQS